MRILSAFLKAGTNLGRDIYPKLKNKALYLPEFQDHHSAFNMAEIKSEVTNI
jgi:hypothetical protein